MVAVPWPAEGGAGTWQQYVSVPEGHLVGPHPSASHFGRGRHMPA